MNEFEEELREQLQQVEMPRGFADRVVRRVEARDEERKRDRKVWRLSIAASLIAGVALGGEAIDMHRKTEQKQAEVRKEFAVAMQVTNKSMLAVQKALDKMDKSNEKGEAE